MVMFETASNTIKKKLEARDFHGAKGLVRKLIGTMDEAVAVGNGTTGSASTESTWHKERAICHDLMGDCEYGLYQLDKALREYEQAIKFMTRVYGPTDFPCMMLLFKIERVLAQMSASQSDFSDQRDRWRAGYLMLAEEKLEAGTYQMTDDELSRQSDLQGLWKKSVKKKKEEKRPPWWKVLSKEGLTFLKQILNAADGLMIVFATIFMFIACCQLLMITIKYHKNLTNYHEQLKENLTPFSPEIWSSALATPSGKEFSYPGGEEKVAFDDKRAIIGLDEKLYGIPYLSEPNNIIQYMKLIFTTTATKCLWLERDIYGFRLPSGTVLLERSSPEFGLSTTASRILADWLENSAEPTASTRGSSRKGAPSWMIYKDPYSKQTRKARMVELDNGTAQDWLASNDDKAAKMPGSIFCFRRKSELESAQSAQAMVVGEDSGYRLPLGKGGSEFFSPKEDMKSDIAEMVDFGGIVVCNQPEMIKQMLACVWLALLSIFAILSLHGNQALKRWRNLCRFIAGGLLGCLMLFLWHNYY